MLVPKQIAAASNKPSMNFIPQVEPYITSQEIEAVSQYLKSGGWLTEFEKTKALEESLARFLGVSYCTVVTSGTAALYLALLSAGVGKGDKVIVPNYTMIATINAVVWAGAEPILVDVDPEHLGMDLEKISSTHKAKALLYVSIGGRSGDMAMVQKYCKKKGLILIEDACQSLGSYAQGRPLGTFGELGIFSFTPHKIITTGQGGAIVTNNQEFNTKIKKLKDFSRTAPASDWHDGLGYNFKFTDLQAVIGLEQLKQIDFRIKRKKEIFEKYRNFLKSVKEIEFLATDLNQTTPWFIDILLPSVDIRDRLNAYLKQNSIGARPFYPPINHQKPYTQFKKDSFPVSEALAYRGTWLPSSVGLDDEKITYVAQTIQKYLKS